MYPKQHIIFGLFFSLILFLLFPKIGFFGAVVIFASSVLIDVDHYIYYVFKKKDFSLKRAYIWNVEISKKFCHLSKEQRKKFHKPFHFFHGIEILIVLFFLGIIYSFFFFILIGFSFHLILDFFYEVKKMGVVTCKFSFIDDFLKSKKYKKIGKN